MFQDCFKTAVEKDKSCCTFVKTNLINLIKKIISVLQMMNFLLTCCFIY